MSADIYAVCVEWAHRSLNPEYWATKGDPDPADQNIRVVQSRQDSPTPVEDGEALENYISIPIAPNEDTQGMDYRLEYDGDNEIQSHIQENRGEIQLREVGGSGANLKKMLRWLYTQDSKDFLRSYQTSILNWGPVNGIPRVDEEEWKEEWVVTVAFLIAAQTDEAITYIETVEINKTYEK